MAEELHHTDSITPTLTANPVDRCYLAKLAIEYRAISSLTPYKRNARTHSRKQIRQIANSIKTFNFTNPILIDANAQIICGMAGLRPLSFLV